MLVLRGIRAASAGREINALNSILLYCLFFWRCLVGHVSKNHSGLLHDVTVHSYLPLCSAPNDICMLVAILLWVPGQNLTALARSR